MNISIKKAAFHRSFLFSTFQSQNVLIFLFFHQFQPRLIKFVHIKKTKCKGTVTQIEKALINDHLRVSRVS